MPHKISKFTKHRLSIVDKISAYKIDHLRKSNSGVSLISIMIAMGIMGAVSLGTVKIMTQSRAMNDVLSERASASTIKRSIMRAVDCERSYQQSNFCASSGFVSLLDINGNTIQSGKKYNSWTFRAYCNATTQETIGQIAILRDGVNYTANMSDSNFKVSKTRKKPYNWRFVQPNSLPICKKIWPREVVCRKTQDIRSLRYDGGVDALGNPVYHGFPEVGNYYLDFDRNDCGGTIPPMSKYDPVLSALSVCGGYISVRVNENNNLPTIRFWPTVFPTTSRSVDPACSAGPMPVTGEITYILRDWD